MIGRAGTEFLIRVAFSKLLRRKRRGGSLIIIPRMWSRRDLRASFCSHKSISICKCSLSWLNSGCRIVSSKGCFAGCFVVAAWEEDNCEEVGTLFSLHGRRGVRNENCSTGGRREASFLGNLVLMWGKKELHAAVGRVTRAFLTYSQTLTFYGGRVRALFGRKPCQCSRCVTIEK